MSQVEKDPNGLGQHQAGAKLDDGKVDMSLLTLWPRALTEVARVGTLGASKYSRGGFLSVANGYIRYTAAMLRHLFKESQSTYDEDPYYDTVHGAPWKGKIRHDAQVAWNALSRLEVKLREEECERRKQEEQRFNASLYAAGLGNEKPGSYPIIERQGLQGCTAAIGQSGGALRGNDIASAPFYRDPR